MTFNFFDNDLTTLHDKLVKQDVTAVELVQGALDNIAKVDDKLEAFIMTNPEAALAQAQVEDDKQDFTQALAGIPFALKDNLATEAFKRPVRHIS